MSKELLYQDIEPFKSETIQVSDVHTVYYEVSGNENGQPALFLHGGPGSGCNAWQRGWFNPKRYKIVLIDQRGCGKSTPIGETKENTTQDLINDIELIRDRLGIKNWKIIFGGSWGSTLILAYLNHVLSKDYKGSLESIESVVMYGVFLGRKREIQSTYNASGPGAHLFPEGFEDFMEPINKMSEELKRNDESTVDLYSKIFNNYSNAFSQEEIDTAVFRWSQWESRISSGVKTPNDWEKIDVSLREEAEKTKSRAILENYYFVNDCFQNGNIFLEKEFAQLVAGANIRVSILIGRHDLVTPPLTAVSLCKNLKNNHVQCVVENTTGGHTALDRCNTEVLLRWINPEDQVQDSQTPV